MHLTTIAKTSQFKTDSKVNSQLYHNKYQTEC